MSFSDYIVPIIICIVFATGLLKKNDIFADFLEGAKEGFSVAVEILPALVALSLCVGALRSSGAISAISAALSPIASAIGFPKECLSLALIRPVSGSGALVLFNEIIKENGPDSFVGRVASVLMGSTETTFYTIAVYLGATKIKKTRHCVFSSLSADLTGFLLSAAAVKIIFYGKF